MENWIGIILIIQNCLLLVVAGWWVRDRVKRRYTPFFNPFKGNPRPMRCGGSYSVDEYLETFEKEDFSEVDELGQDPLAPTFDTIREVVESGTYDGTEENELEEGYGEFGWDLTNPIPTVNRRGARQYLSVLRTLDGKPVRHRLQGSYKAENIDYPVDLYILYADEEEVGRIYISSFQGTNSRKAPDGFYLDIGKYES